MAQRKLVVEVWAVRFGLGIFFGTGDGVAKAKGLFFALLAVLALRCLCWMMCWMSQQLEGLNSGEMA